MKWRAMLPVATVSIDTLPPLPDGLQREIVKQARPGIKLSFFHGVHKHADAEYQGAGHASFRELYESKHELITLRLVLVVDTEEFFDYYLDSDDGSGDHDLERLRRTVDAFKRIAFPYILLNIYKTFGGNAYSGASGGTAYRTTDDKWNEATTLHVVYAEAQENEVRGRLNAALAEGVTREYMEATVRPYFERADTIARKEVAFATTPMYWDDPRDEPLEIPYGEDLTRMGQVVPRETDKKAMFAFRTGDVPPRPLYDGLEAPGVHATVTLSYSSTVEGLRELNKLGDPNLDLN